MDGDTGTLDSMPWLKADLLSGFSDLLDDERISGADFHNATATLGSSDLAVSLPCQQNMGLSTDQVRTISAGG